jgi:drug/metabolite transporter (DMT)-like permease
MKTWIVLILAMVSQAFGNTLLSKGMRLNAAAASLVAAPASLAVHTLESPLIWLGTAFLAVFFALFAAALAWADLSYVLPICSFGYVVNVGFASYFLGEEVSPERWAGVALISLGVVLVGRSRSAAEHRGPRGSGGAE